MNLAQRLPYQNGAAPARPDGDDMDDEEEALVNDYREQVQFDDGTADLNRSNSMSQLPPTEDIQSRLQAAATPLEYQASLETKFASYDNYCSLFHFILNNEAGPVDLEVPSVSILSLLISSLSFALLTYYLSHTGPGTSLTNSSTNSIPSAATATKRLGRGTTARRSKC